MGEETDAKQSQHKTTTKSSKTASKVKKGWSKIKRAAKTIRKKLKGKTKARDHHDDITLSSAKKDYRCRPAIVKTNVAHEARGHILPSHFINVDIPLNDSQTTSQTDTGIHVRDDRDSECHSVSSKATCEISDSSHSSKAKPTTDYKEPRAPSNPPEVRPPTTLRSELFSSAEVFMELDRRAMQFARRRSCDLEKTIKRLIRECKCDLQKARVLFRWVVAKDLISRNAKKLNWTVSTSGDVTDLQKSRELFHRLYQTVCRLAGLHCEVISGFSKGAGYIPGMRIKGESFRNCWTAVAIDGTWRFVNCTWAARQVTSTRLNSCDEFYFLTDPKEHIFQHYPDDPKWQLLEEPLPVSEFTKLPLVKSPFFNNSLRFSTCYESRTISTNGKAEFRLLVPDHVKMGCRLKSAARSSTFPQPNAGVGLRFSGNEAVFTVLSRDKGRFLLTLYAASHGNDECLESVCTFSIKFMDPERCV